MYLCYGEVGVSDRVASVWWNGGDDELVMIWENVVQPLA
jgi:hypothetical protein